MNTFRTLAFAAAVTLGAALPAAAMTAAELTGFKSPVTAPAAFLFAGPLSPDGAARLDRVDTETARAAAESYFDYDAVITLGALALAGGGLSAFAAFAARRRKIEETDEPAWRNSVFRAIQADLAQYAESLRHVA